MKTYPIVTRVCLAYITCVSLVGITACSSNPDRVRRDLSYETVRADILRNTEHAQELNQEALKLIDESKFEEAATLLKNALAADITFGPAHNQLGHVYYKQQNTTSPRGSSSMPSSSCPTKPNHATISASFSKKSAG